MNVVHPIYYLGNSLIICCLLATYGWDFHIMGFHVNLADRAVLKICGTKMMPRCAAFSHQKATVMPSEGALIEMRK